MIVFLQVLGGASENDEVEISSKSARDSATTPQPRGLVSGLYSPGSLKTWYLVWRFPNDYLFLSLCAILTNPP